MNDSQYNTIADELLFSVEEAIEECGHDIDFEGISGLLTLTFKNGTKIILNKQAPLHEIWVATKFNGHHFQYVNDQWFDKRGEHEFWSFISEAVSIQADAKIKLASA